MKGEVNGLEWEVKFEHGTTKVFVRGSLQSRRVTEATLVVDDGFTESPRIGKKSLFIGLAICNPDDTFTKRYGRKESLKKALEDFTDTYGTDAKQIRTAIWRSYLTRPGGEVKIENWKGQRNEANSTAT